MLRGYRTELAPTIEQRKQLQRQAGAARWAYNWALVRWREQHERAQALRAEWTPQVAAVVDPTMRAFGKSLLDWKLRREEPNAWSLHGELTEAKRSNPDITWLKQISSYVPREALADLQSAYQNFFRRVGQHKHGDHSDCSRRRDGGCNLGVPDFRSRLSSSGRGFRVGQPQAISVTECGVKIAGVGLVRLKEHGYIPVGRSARGLGVSQRAGRWFVAVQFEEDRPSAPRRVGVRLGVEVGVRELAVTSEGGPATKRFGAVRDLEGMDKAWRKLALWSRRQNRRHEKGKSNREQSAGWHEAVAQVQRCHMRIANMRKDMLQQTSTRIVRQRAETIVMRDMDVSGMVGRAGKSGPQRRKRNVLAPMVAKVGFYGLRRMVEYKQSWAGGSFVLTPKGHPTTRTCSKCGAVRESEAAYPDFVCPACSHRENREDNAARNLSAFVPGATLGGTRGGARRGKTGRKAGTMVGKTGKPGVSRTSLTTDPDGDATSPLGSDKRTSARTSADGTDEGNLDPTAGAVSAQGRSTHAPNERRGDASANHENKRALASAGEAAPRHRSKVGGERGEFAGESG